MNLSLGIKTKLRNRQIVEWLAYGGEKEDDAHGFLGPFNTRPANHFHNPLTTTLSEAGFSGIWGTGTVDGTSAMLWAQAESGTQSPGGTYSWHDARQYYFSALSDPIRSMREIYFAESFRAVGQVMHMVQDMGVPEHARDDGHYFDAYEAWLVDRKTQGQLLVNEALANPYVYDMAWLKQPSPFPFDAPVPIARLFDANRYDGSNPASTVEPGIGLAEYTNANFVSANTLLPAAIPYPNRNTSVKVADCAIANPLNPGETVLRPYYLKVGDGEQAPLATCGTAAPVQGYHLAGVGFFQGYRAQPDVLEQDLLVLPILDDNVYADCARLLLPRAVGYSTALLHYFFRGEIDLVPDSTDDNSYRIKNLTNERMTGKFYLFKDDAEGNIRSPVEPREGTALDIPPQGEVLTTINPPLNLEAWNSYVLVFRGRLGNEEGAVIGKVLSGAIWREEWDAGLKGNHPWLATGIDLVTENPPQAATTLQVDAGKLTMENRRPAATRSAQVNHVVIGEADLRSGDVCYLGNDVLPCDFTREFPLVITPGTTLKVKIDKSTINQVIPAQSCVWNTQPIGAFQGIFLQFTLADGRGFSLHLGTSGHEGRMWPYETVPLATEYAVNLYELLARNGAGAVPVTLDFIDVVQQMLPLCDPSASEHVQQMEIDYIRVGER